MSRATRQDLETALDQLGNTPSYQHLRPAETGLVMLRGRAGGNGQPFNLGEMTVTRCSVTFSDGTQGHGYTAGRDKAKAELIAVLDGIMQQGDHTLTLQERLIDPLLARFSRQKDRQSRKAAATKVDFFTMARESTS